MRVLKTFFENLERSVPEFAQSFYNRFYLEILQHMFAVVTYSIHYAGKTILFLRALV